jgi:hypothetical protein
MAQTPWGSETLSPAADSVHQLDPPQARFRSATYGLIRRDLLGSEADEWSAFDADRADLVFARARVKHLKGGSNIGGTESA